MKGTVEEKYHFHRGKFNNKVKMPEKFKAQYFMGSQKTLTPLF